MTTIDQSQMREALVAVVAEKGEDFVYDKPCQYMIWSQPDGRPQWGCIVGQVMPLWGGTFESVEAADVNSDTGASSALPQVCDTSFTERALRYAEGAQWAQDKHHTYADVIAFADWYVANYEERPSWCAHPASADDWLQRWAGVKS